MTLLFLLNASKFAIVVETMIGGGETEGFFIEVLYGYMENKLKIKRQWVIANIFVNISSTEIGRKYLATSKLYLRFLSFINGTP